MALFITNASTTLARGVYAIDTPTPAVIQPVGTDVTMMVGQLPWGPPQVPTFNGIGNLLQQFVPLGMNRLGSAYLSLIAKAWPSPGVQRIADTTALTAAATIASSVPTNLFTVTAIALGSAGNSIIITIGPASDGNSNHFNLTAQVSGTSGTTSETYQNWNISGTGADFFGATDPTFSQSVLLGSVAKLAAGIPAAGNTTMSGGTDGTVNAASYIGTPGAGDKGFSLLEPIDTLNHVFIDDPGPSLRTAINTGLVAHVELTTDRVCYINGPSGQTAAQAQTDVATYTRSIRTVYCDPWCFITDDTVGASRLTPSASFAASVAAQLPPSTSIAWRDDRVSGLLASITQLEANRSAVRANNTAAGITTLIKRKRGGFTFEAGVNTSLTSGVTNLTRTRMGQYIARSTTLAWEPFVEGPNIPVFQQELINSLDAFLGGLQTNSQSVNAAFQAYILNYGISSIAAANTTAFVQGGNFNVDAQVQLGANMSRIYLSLTYGESVQVQVH